MARTMHKSLVVFALAAVSVFLKGCTFGDGVERCDGEGCSCTWTFHSFWARIFISGVPIEHTSRVFYIPNVAKDVPNASFAPCCDAIFNQIDYDEGKTPSMPNRTVQSFGTSCSSSPNKEIVSAASYHNSSEVVATRLHGLRKSAPLRQDPARPLRQDPPDGYQPIHDGQEGQDCEVTTSHGFPLNTVLISSGSMKLKIKWVDPEQGSTSCCNALRPLLESVYMNGVHESKLPADVQKNFCDSCKGSPNQGVALAAFRCFGAAPDPIPPIQTEKTVAVEV